MDKLHCEALLMPYPITPTAAFASFVWKRLEMISEGTYVRYHHLTERHPGSAASIGFFGGGATWKITHAIYEKQSGLTHYLEQLIANWAPHSDQRLLKRVLTFCAYGGDQYKRKELEKITRWLMKMALTNKGPHEAICAATEYFERYITEGVDPWRELLPVPTAEIPESPPIADYPRGIRPITIPILKEGRESETAVLHYTTEDLRVGNMWKLQGESLCVVVGGPSGSGKSTLVATITAIIENIIRATKSLGNEWERLSLRVEPVALDLATPVLAAVRAGRGKDRLEVDILKQPWTRELAIKALYSVRGAFSQGANVVIADLPGQITEITEIVGAVADVGIIVTNDWGKLNEWESFMHTMGITVVAEIKSGETSSLVTRYQPGRFLRGRVAQLDRASRTWDPTVSTLAELLLMEFLPAFVEERRGKLREKLFLRQIHGDPSLNIGQ
jgi:energy-coupling factor transporter ATP-binding protein EcfA2